MASRFNNHRNKSRAVKGCSDHTDDTQDYNITGRFYCYSFTCIVLKMVCS